MQKDKLNSGREGLFIETQYKSKETDKIDARHTEILSG